VPRAGARLAPRVPVGGAGGPCERVRRCIQLLGGGIDHPGVYHITGLVPDGVNTVQLHLADGTADTLTVTENVYMADITVGITSTTFSLPDGTTVTLGQNGPPSNTNVHMTGAPCAPAVDTNCPSTGTT